MNVSETGQLPGITLRTPPGGDEDGVADVGAAQTKRPCRGAEWPVQHRNGDGRPRILGLLGKLLPRRLHQLFEGSARTAGPVLAVFSQALHDISGEPFLCPVCHVVALGAVAIEDTKQQGLRTCKHEEVVLIRVLRLEATVTDEADAVLHPGQLPIEVYRLLPEVRQEAVAVGGFRTPDREHLPRRLDHLGWMLSRRSRTPSFPGLSDILDQVTDEAVVGIHCEPPAGHTFAPVPPHNPLASLGGELFAQLTGGGARRSDALLCSGTHILLG
mmetsp:Transcript_52016/g.111322  ORF Transcript_52016/g.111322 Transcript_52016/m.111322 type:complete len:272 (+) Transcript_52016:567-1382(+)